MIIRALLWTALSATLAFAQVSNASLRGTYFYRHVLMVSDGAGGVVDARTSAGTLTFDGAGGFSYIGQQLVNAAAPTALVGNGTYAVKSGGVLALTNPFRTNDKINARLGAGALVGASTEIGANVFDLFIAIPAPTAAQSNARLNGPYYVSSLEYPGSVTNVRNTNFKLTANGAGAFAESTVVGQARNLGNRRLSQTLSPITYAISSDGSGTLNFPVSSGSNEVSQLIAGAKNIYVSADGNTFIGGSMTAGSHGMVIGMKAFGSNATNSSLSGFFYGAGLRLDVDRGRFTSTSSSINATALGAVFGRRTRQSDGVFDAATLATYALSGDGSGLFTSTNGTLNLAASGTMFSTSGVDDTDSFTYELSFAVRMPTMSGTGVFVDPQRVLNGASYALGYPISPGGFVTLFGTGLATQTTSAKIPFPSTLGNITVSVNGKSAPIYVVSPTQVSFVVPYSVTGTTATIVVTSNGTASNAVEVPLAPTAPGVFSLTQNGLGDGAILHANFSVVNDASPATVGEIVQVFLSGMGAVTPNVVEGNAAPSTNPLAQVTAPTAVTIGGKTADILYNGLAPGLAGLYQLNVRVPSVQPGIQSLAIQTLDGFTDMVNLRVR